MTPNIKSSNSGFTLLEMMIAVLIISFGLLGLAGLQAASLRNNHSAYLRSVATQLAYELSDRVRANKTIDYSTATPTPHSSCSVSCTPIQIAEDDLDHWRTEVAAALPGSPVPTLTKSASGSYSLNITWIDDKSGATTSFDTSFMP